MRHIVVLALLVGAALTPVAAASPQPDPVCPVCDRTIERTTGNTVAVNVAHSNATVQLHANGSATWRIENRIESGAAHLAEDGEWGPPDSFARELLSLSADRRVLALSARLRGDRYVVQFRVVKTSERIGDVLLWDRIRRRGVWPALQDTRLTVRPPSGWVITNRPAADTATDHRVVWDRASVGSSLPAGAYVAAMPADANAERVRTGAAIAADHSSRLSPLLLPGSAYASIAVGLLVGVLLAVRRIDHEPKEGNKTVPWILLGLIGVGPLVVAFAFTVSVTLLAIVLLGLGGLGFGYLILSRRNPGPGRGARWRRFVNRLDDHDLPGDPHQTTAWAAGFTALLTCWIVLEGLRTLLGGQPGIGSRIGLALLIAPLAIAFPLGLAFGREERAVGDQLLAAIAFWLASLGGFVATFGPDLQHDVFEVVITLGYSVLVIVLGIAIGTVGVIAGRTWVSTDRSTAETNPTSDGPKSQAGS